MCRLSVFNRVRDDYQIMLCDFDNFKCKCHLIPNIKYISIGILTTPCVRVYAYPKVHAISLKGILLIVQCLFAKFSKRRAGIEATLRYHVGLQVRITRYITGIFLLYSVRFIISLFYCKRKNGCLNTLTLFDWQTWVSLLYVCTCFNINIVIKNQA